MGSTQRILSRSSEGLRYVVVATLVFATALAAAAQRDGAPRATTIVGADVADGSGAALRRGNLRFVGDRIAARRRRRAAAWRHGR